MQKMDRKTVQAANDECLLDDFVRQNESFMLKQKKTGKSGNARNG